MNRLVLFISFMLAACASVTGSLWSSPHLMDTTFERVLGQFRADTSCDAQSVSGSDYFSREGQRYKHGENQPIASQVEQDWLAFGCSKSYWYTARISSSKPGSLEITISEPRRSPPPRSAAQLKEPPLRPGS